MLAKLATLLTVIGISNVQAQLVYECDSYTEPNYDSCDRVIANIDWTESPYNGGRPIRDGACNIFSDPTFSDGQDANCVIAVCNTRGDGQDSYLNVISGPTYYRLIKQWCEPQGSGGRAPGPAQIEAGSNQYVEAGAVPASFARRSSIRTTTRSAKPQLRVDSKTIEEMEVFWETVRNETIQRHSAPTIQKRQEEVLVLGLSKSVTRPSVSNRMSGITSPGVSTEWSTTEGFSTSVGVSAELSVGFFDIFTASVGIEVSMEFSQEYTRTIEFDPSKSCSTSQEAFMVFLPHFDHYVVADENGNQYDIWIPVEGGDVAVQCLG
ncbi:hypothetical protein J4E90_002463 [Alternaria incomplexa]|uniref:uncharacterized protein n=1 Tax=Alternaria incomplexa TaxID=1187928 RepID=UPI00221E6448|nr:uncharacterized protein J4E90_002463 [Alternaria incomplexa]KAI4918083.1 hypothetical protein J4E90_002463 [Alternaria incomplexa]